MKKLNLRNKIVRTITYLTLGFTVASFYGWFGAEIIFKLLA